MLCSGQPYMELLPTDRRNAVTTFTLVLNEIMEKGSNTPDFQSWVERIRTLWDITLVLLWTRLTSETSGSKCLNPESFDLLFYRGISINISRVMTNNESVWRNCTLTASLPITGGGAEGLIIVTLNNTCITLLICYRWEGRLMCILSCGGGGGGRGGGHLRHTELVHGEDLKYSAWRLFIEDTLLCFKWIFLWVF